MKKKTKQNSHFISRIWPERLRGENTLFSLDSGAMLKETHKRQRDGSLRDEDPPPN